MTYLEKVLSRVTHPGFIILLVGGVIGFLSGPIAARLWPEKKETAGLAIKAGGCLMALVGILLLFEFI
ncbi:MAG: hypothetical protein Q4C54_00010 [Clostridia bacterium]|nr:hypothetical protein [Clostridia bacterium]